LFILIFVIVKCNEFLCDICQVTGQKSNQIVQEDKKLREKIDFYYNEEGLMVFTREYLLKRGYCCRNGCRHCPYGYAKKHK